MKVGRPLKYKTVEELNKAIESYFDENYEAPTIAGLARYLGFMDRQSMYDYEDRKEFSCAIKNAMTRIEQKHEENLYSHSCTGSIFWLKNRDNARWRDKTEHDLQSSDGSMSPKTLQELYDEEREGTGS